MLNTPLETATEWLALAAWGGDGEAVQLEKGSGVGNCLKTVRIPSVGCTNKEQGAHFSRQKPSS